MPTNDSLGDLLKEFENQECSRYFAKLLPIITRIDGRSFHQFTKDLQRPYDINLSNLMIDTTKYLLNETQADLGYCQSDEISLIFSNNSLTSETFFARKIFKIISTISALTSVYFNSQLPNYLPEKKDKLPTFDCRAFQLPNNQLVIDYLSWREADATRNSISMAAQACYSHKELQNKNSSELQELLFQKDINWNNYPDFFKRGTYLRKVKKLRKFEAEEIEKLPLNHAARHNPNLEVHRNEVIKLNIPPIKTLLNPYNVLFGNCWTSYVEGIIKPEEQESLCLTN